MVVNLTKLIRYRPLTKSIKGQVVLGQLAIERNVPPERLMRAFTLFLAVLIRRHVQNAVKTQKIGGKPMSMVYKPLSPKYNQSKPLQTQGKFWRNTDFLIANLKVWQLKNGDVFVGYRGNAVHRGTPYQAGKKRVKASQVMVYMEKGTKKMPPRPLFSVIVRNIAKNISFYLEMFIRQLDKGQIKI